MRLDSTKGDHCLDFISELLPSKSAVQIFILEFGNLLPNEIQVPSFQFAGSVLLAISTVEFKIIEPKLELKVVKLFAKLNTTSIIFVRKTGVKYELEERMKSVFLRDGLDPAQIYSHDQIHKD